MPNYNDRRYHSEHLRREADGLMERYGVTPRTMPHIHALLDAADKYDTMNDRRGYEHDDANPEMRRNRMEYDEMEMRRGGARRRNSQGEFTRSEYDNYSPQMRYDAFDMSYNRSNYGGYYPNEEHPLMTYGASQERQKSNMGFAGNKSSRDSLGEQAKEISDYMKDWAKHKRNYEQTQSPEEKKHYLLELEELTSIMEELFGEIAKKATTPEEKQYIQQMKQKIQMMQ